MWTNRSAANALPFGSPTPLNLPAGIDKLLFDLFNISQDQVHHLWSMLGGKYIPSVVYRLRMLTIWQLQETPAGIIRKVKMKDNVL